MSKRRVTSPRALKTFLDADTDNFVELTKLLELDPGSDFRFTDLSGVDFGTADLTGYDFSYSKLRGCNLSKAKTRRAIFEGADTVGCLWPELEFDPIANASAVFIYRSFLDSLLKAELTISQLEDLARERIWCCYLRTDRSSPGFGPQSYWAVDRDRLWMRLRQKEMFELQDVLPLALDHFDPRLRISTRNQWATLGECTTSIVSVANSVLSLKGALRSRPTEKDLRRIDERLPGSTLEANITVSLAVFRLDRIQARRKPLRMTARDRSRVDEAFHLAKGVLVGRHVSGVVLAALRSNFNVRYSMDIAGARDATTEDVPVHENVVLELLGKRNSWVNGIVHRAR